VSSLFSNWRRRVHFSGVGFFGIGLCLALSTPALAQDDIRHELAKATHEEREMLEEVQDLERQLIAVEQDIEGLQATSDKHEQSRVRHSDELAAATASLDRLEVDIAARTRALYRIHRRGFARIIFSTEDPGNLRKTGHYLKALLNEDESRTARIVKQLNLKKAALKRVESDRSALSALQAELRLKEAELLDKKARRMTVLEEVQTRKGLAQAALQLRERGRVQIQDRLPAAPAAESTSAAPVAAKKAFRELQGRLPWPTTGTILRAFGRTLNPATQTQEQNDGIDIKAAFGTPVRSVAAGVVNHTGYVDGFGLVVVLEHGPYATVYAHLGKIQVTRGEQVDPGENLGLVGETGVTDAGGPRLHFEVRYHQSPQNPTQWLRSRSRGGR
jgi:murein DD-endopeptidase MepM/ murein hydrolase activator NlpD